MSEKKFYLGDSVYMQVDEHGDVVLTTENGSLRDPSNKIILEPEVARELMGYLLRLNK